MKKVKPYAELTSGGKWNRVRRFLRGLSDVEMQRFDAAQRRVLSAPPSSPRAALRLARAVFRPFRERLEAAGVDFDVWVVETADIVGSWSR